MGDGWRIQGNSVKAKGEIAQAIVIPLVNLLMVEANYAPEHLA